VLGVLLRLRLGPLCQRRLQQEQPVLCRRQSRDLPGLRGELLRRWPLQGPLPSLTLGLSHRLWMRADAPVLLILLVRILPVQMG